MGQTEAPKPKEQKEPMDSAAFHVFNPADGPFRGMPAWYQDNYDGEPCAAIVTHVWPRERGRLVNLTVFTRDGEPRAAVRVYRGASVGTWRPPGAAE